MPDCISITSHHVFRNVRFQPSDYDQSVFETIKRNRIEDDNNNVADPVLIDLTAPATWPDSDERLYDVIFVINIFHVAPVSIATASLRLAQSS
ncbi:DUF938 domain-containing protein [Bradyrhizobium sp. CB3481]|uniref:DUF938 domain-containing protein n=1 Tax=Bradyrhizobium sp. CB3481 TaxID=3039158 RepID=UPI0032C2221E